MEMTHSQCLQRCKRVSSELVLLSTSLHLHFYKKPVYKKLSFEDQHILRTTFRATIRCRVRKLEA